MYAGIAGGLLVFTGVWHASEWMMDGRRRDTWRLVPVGLIYLVLGWMIALGAGGMATQIIALLLALLFGFLAFTRRSQLDLRRWVIWSLITCDALIAACLLIALIGS